MQALPAGASGAVPDWALAMARADMAETTTAAAVSIFMLVIVIPYGRMLQDVPGIMYGLCNISAT